MKKYISVTAVNDCTEYEEHENPPESAVHDRPKPVKMHKNTFSKILSDY